MNNKNPNPNSETSILDQEQTQKVVKISNQTVAYYVHKPDSKYVAVTIHQHLGLVDFIVNSSRALTCNSFNLIIPDLFISIANKQPTISFQQFDFCKHLTYSSIKTNIIQCMEYVKKRNSHQKLKFIIIGFSIGAAYAFKILQEINQFQQAYLFYGVPQPKTIQPDKIKTKTMIFYGTKDKIKYLSDPITMKEAQKICQSNSLIQFKAVNGLGHGFMNPQCKQFSQSYFNKFGLLISRGKVGVKSTEDQQIIKTNLRLQQQKRKKNKEQQSDCIVY